MPTRAHTRTRLARGKQPDRRRTTLTGRPDLTQRMPCSARDGACMCNKSYRRKVAQSALSAHASWTPKEIGAVWSAREDRTMGKALGSHRREARARRMMRRALVR